MTTVHAITGALDDQLRRELIYAGDLIVYKDIPAMRELVGLTDRLVQEGMGVPEPPLAHLRMDAERFAGRFTPLRQAYRRNEEVSALLRKALEQVGVPGEPTFWDGVKLRSLPDGSREDDARGTAPLGWHRDTWASNVYAQSNWWAPIYRIAPGRTVTFHPVHWHTPVANDSAGWDLEDVKARRARGEPAALIPGPTGPVDTSAEIRVVLEPGDLLCFSGAQLHASVPNRSGLTRFSIEVRTVDARDVADGRGAPNVDGAASRVLLQWFNHVADGRPLTEAAGDEAGQG